MNNTKEIEKNKISKMENFVKVENFLNICRFCLQESMQMKHLIDNDKQMCENKTIKTEDEAKPEPEISEGESSIIKIINVCTGLQVNIQHFIII